MKRRQGAESSETNGGVSCVRGASFAGPEVLQTGGADTMGTWTKRRVSKFGAESEELLGGTTKEFFAGSWQLRLTLRLAQRHLELVYMTGKRPQERFRLARRLVRWSLAVRSVQVFERFF